MKQGGGGEIMALSVEERKERLKAANDLIDAVIVEHDRQWEALKAKDQEAKGADTLVGRYISEPSADGHAVYDIVAVGEDTVDIEVIDIDDAWVIPYWGRKATIGREYVQAHVENRDRIKELFS